MSVAHVTCSLSLNFLYMPFSEAAGLVSFLLRERFCTFLHELWVSAQIVECVTGAR